MFLSFTPPPPVGCVVRSPRRLKRAGVALSAFVLALTLVSPVATVSAHNDNPHVVNIVEGTTVTHTFTGLTPINAGGPPRVGDFRIYVAKQHSDDIVVHYDKGFGSGIITTSPYSHYADRNGEFTVTIHAKADNEYEPTETARLISSADNTVTRDDTLLSINIIDASLAPLETIDISQRAGDNSDRTARIKPGETKTVVFANFPANIIPAGEVWATASFQHGTRLNLVNEYEFRDMTTDTRIGSSATRIELDSNSDAVLTVRLSPFNMRFDTGSWIRIAFYADRGRSSHIQTTYLSVQNRPTTNNLITVPADWPLIPNGLTAGDSFRLMFSSSPVTSDSSPVTSNDPSKGAYDALVSADARTGSPHIPGYIADKYTALVSTVDQPDIRDNTGTNGAGVPIYWMEGSKVADDYTDFYDGSWDNPRDVRTSTGKGQNFGDVGFHYHGTGTFYRGNGAQIGGLTLEDDVCDGVGGARHLCEGGEGIGIVCTGHGDTQPGCSSTRRLGQDLITCSVIRDYGFSRRECAPLMDRAAIFGLSPVFKVNDLPTSAAQSLAAVPSLTLSADAAPVSEGGRATFTITADPVLYNDVTVNVGTEQEMGEGLDYIGSGTTQQVTIPAGQATATWTVTAHNDDQHRTDGRIQAHIKPGDGYTLGVPHNVTLDLLDDDDPPPQPEVTVTATNNNVTEGDPAVFTITATPPPVNDLTVNITTTQNGDYGAFTGSRTVTIPTTGSATLSIATTNDAIDEPDGSVTTTINTGNGYTVSTTHNTNTITVTDNDNPPQPEPAPAPTRAPEPAPAPQPTPQPAPTPTRAPAPQPQPTPQPVVEPVTLTVSDAEATEGRTLDFVITLNRAARTPVEITYSTLRGEATDDDYTHTVGTITINAGETRRTVHIRTTADDINEQPERMILYLVSVDGAEPDRRSATGTINNN